MPRERLRPGEWGEITTSRVSADPVRHRARARFRGEDGRKRVIERHARHSPCRGRSPDRRPRGARPLGRGSGLARRTPSSSQRSSGLARWRSSSRPVSVPPAPWRRIAECSMGMFCPPSVHCRPSQVTTPTANRVIVDIHTRVGPSTARTCRSIVSGIMGRAVRHGAVATNPAREVERLRVRPQRQPRALTVKERTQWFVGVAGNQKAIERDLLDLSAFLLQPAFASGKRWRSRGPRSTSRQPRSRFLDPIRVTGRGLIRKGTKSEAGQRRLRLPVWCITMLQRRAQTLYDPERPVFGTIDGDFRGSPQRQPFSQGGA